MRLGVQLGLAVWLLAAAGMAARAAPGDDQFDVAAGHYHARRWSLAAAEFQTFLERHPDHSRRPKAAFFLGESLVQGGDLAAARDAFSSFLKIEPEGPRSRAAKFRLGECPLFLGHKEEAEAALRRFHDQHPDDSLNLYALGYLGELALASRNGQNAKQFYSEALERFPSSNVAAEWNLGLAQAHFLLGENAPARALLSDLLDNRQFRLPAAFWMGEVCRSERKFADAGAFFENALALQQDPAGAADLRRRCAESWIRAGQFDKALTLLSGGGLEEAVGTLPPEELCLVATACNGLGRHADVLRLLEKLASDDASPHRASSLLVRGASLAALGETQAAIADFEQSRSLAADRPAVWEQASAQLIEALGRAKKFDQATSCLTELRRVAPESERTLHAMTRLAEQAERAAKLELAMALWELLGEQEQDRDLAASSRLALGSAQLATDRLVESAATIGRWIESFPNHPATIEALLIRGTALERLVQTGDALDCYHQAIDLSPHVKKPDQAEFNEAAALAILSAARLHAQNEQLDEADKLFTRLTSDYGNWPRIDSAWLAWGCALESSQAAAAKDKYARLREQFPSSSHRFEATLRLAQLLSREQKFLEAAQLLDEIIAAPSPPRGGSASNDSKIHERALFLRAQLAALTGDWARTEDFVERFLTQFPQSTKRPLARLLAADTAFQQGNLDLALERFDSLSKQMEGLNEKWAPLVGLRRAQVLAQQNRWAEALRLAESIPAQYPQFERLAEVHLVVGRGWMADARFDAARAAFHRTLEVQPGNKSETAAEAQWLIGEAYFHEEKYADAIREYLRLEILYAYPQWQAAALLQAGKCHERLRQWSSSAALYQRILEKYSDTSIAAEAQERAQALQKLTAERPNPKPK